MMGLQSLFYYFDQKEGLFIAICNNLKSFCPLAAYNDNDKLQSAARN